jgi:hypothetical protein
MSVLDDLRQSVIDGNAPSAQDLVKRAMSASLPPDKILNEWGDCSNVASSLCRRC